VFNNDKWFTTVCTVEELIKELACLPPNLLVKQGSKDCTDIVILNRDTDDEHISFEEGGEWDKIIATE